MTPSLRPLGLGELLDRSVNFWRGNWKPLFRLMLAFQLVQLILMKGMQFATRKFFPLMSSPDVVALARNEPDRVLPQALGAMAVMVSVIVLLLFISQISGVATTHYAWGRLLGTATPSPGDAFRHAATRLGPATGAFALSIGWTGVVMLVMLLPAAMLGGGAVWLGSDGLQGGAVALLILSAVAALAGFVVLTLWFIIRFVLMAQILAVEDVGAWAAFRRADRLSSGRVLSGFGGLVKVRLTVLITVMGGVLLIISTVATLPSLIAGGFFGATFAPGKSIEDVVPALILVPLEVLQTTLGSLVAPLYIVFQIFFYADMRMRREGLDLDVALGARPT